MKILLAEDDPVSLHSLKRTLEKWGHEVTATSSGDEAWDAFRAGAFPIVISDWMMPGMDGVELLEHIRERKGDRYAYVILLTARQEKQDLVEAMSAGADDFLTKPFDRDELRVRLRAGIRVTELQHTLAQRNAELGDAYAELSRTHQRMTEDLAAAARIQQSLLPSILPVFPGIDFAWRFEPCDELAGDILNVFPLDDRHAGFYLLDVSGHGVQAALLSVTLSRVLVPSPEQSSLLTRHGAEDGATLVTNPVEVARRLNHRFAHGASTGQFFTLMYGVYDTQSRELEYVTAGHPGPVLISNDQPPRMLEATGPPIGILEGLSFEQAKLKLRPGDRLYVYSDGLTEARNGDGVHYGYDRLVDCVSRQRDKELDASLPELMQSVHAWRGVGGLEDDASCLALEVGA